MGGEPVHIHEHAIRRFRQRAKSNRSDPAIVETLKRMARDWRRIEADETTGACKLYSHGWVLIVIGDSIKTVYRER